MFVVGEFFLINSESVNNRWQRWSVLCHKHCAQDNISLPAINSRLLHAEFIKHRVPSRGPIRTQFFPLFYVVSYTLCYVRCYPQTNCIKNTMKFVKAGTLLWTNILCTQFSRHYELNVRINLLQNDRRFANSNRFQEMFRSNKKKY